MIDVKLGLLYSNTWNHLTVRKKKKKVSSGSFKNVIKKMSLHPIVLDVLSYLPTPLLRQDMTQSQFF